MISPKHKSIFVHIPKVAGQSIETLFLEDLGLSWDARKELLLRKKETNEPGPDRLAHLRAKDYVAMGYVNATDFKQYFTFSFVRNPYGRVLSYYHYLGYSRIVSVSAFVQKVLSKKIAADHFFFQSQYDYLYSDNGTLLVDFVGKLEHISKDIQYVLEKTGMENKVLPHVNKSEKGLKRGLAALLRTPSLWKHIQVRRLFSSEKTKALSEAEKEGIYQLYSIDFECFDYER
jgi:hypothetical protein